MTSDYYRAEILRIVKGLATADSPESELETLKILGRDLEAALAKEDARDDRING